MQEESKFVLDESGKLLIEPYMEELPDLFVSYFKAILGVGENIPRLEYYMSQREIISKFIFNLIRFLVLFWFYIKYVKSGIVPSSFFCR